MRALRIGDRVEIIPNQYHPQPRTGVIVEKPPRDHIGMSAKIRWDDTSREEWLGSLQQYRLLT